MLISGGSCAASVKYLHPLDHAEWGDLGAAAVPQVAPVVNAPVAASVWYLTLTGGSLKLHFSSGHTPGNCQDRRTPFPPPRSKRSYGEGGMQSLPGAPTHSRDRRLHCPQCPCTFTHRMGLFGHMRIHDSGIHHNADSTDTPCTPSAPAVLSAPDTPTTMNDIPPAPPDFSLPQCAHNFNSRIGLVGHLQSHRTVAGEPCGLYGTPTPWDPSQVWWHTQGLLWLRHPPVPSPISGLLDSAMTPGSGGGGGEIAVAAAHGYYHLELIHVEVTVPAPPFCGAYLDVVGLRRSYCRVRAAHLISSLFDSALTPGSSGGVEQRVWYMQRADTTRSVSGREPSAHDPTSDLLDFVLTPGTGG
ncbi:unnamed protein product [Schistocephalus solidus]|uniref:C2H2-type domain-containing protein n=1 Tax=Schistocephalus solidus TaxID=70667 RepID=A0A183SJN2_SCHSO|nr:unnamed protein product [Schistocephalus solidus]